MSAPAASKAIITLEDLLASNVANTANIRGVRPCSVVRASISAPARIIDFTTEVELISPLIPATLCKGVKPLLSRALMFAPAKISASSKPFRTYHTLLHGAKGSSHSHPEPQGLLQHRSGFHYIRRLATHCPVQGGPAIRIPSLKVCSSIDQCFHRHRRPAKCCCMEQKPSE